MTARTRTDGHTADAKRAKETNERAAESRSTRVRAPARCSRALLPRLLPTLRARARASARAHPVRPTIPSSPLSSPRRRSIASALLSPRRRPWNRAEERGTGPPHPPAPNPQPTMGDAWTRLLETESAADLFARAAAMDIPTGIFFLDDVGLRRGDLLEIAGPSGSGKTELLQQARRGNSRSGISG